MSGEVAVTLEPAARAEEPVLARLLELYVHDLSEVFAVEIGADGRFGYERLPSYWSEPERRFPFLIRAGGKLAGFALATRGLSQSEDPDLLDVAEFFVLRSYRRSGVGREAAFLLWRRLPGRWEVRVSEGNRAGIPFWLATVQEFASRGFTESRRPGKPGSAFGWRVFSFDNGPSLRT